VGTVHRGVWLQTLHETLCRVHTCMSGMSNVRDRSYLSTKSWCSAQPDPESRRLQLRLLATRCVLRKASAATGPHVHINGFQQHYLRRLHSALQTPRFQAAAGIDRAALVTLETPHYTRMSKRLPDALSFVYCAFRVGTGLRDEGSHQYAACYGPEGIPRVFE
jgi:hypothetical protein